MIETSALTKRYGNLTALESVNLQINDGEIYGFIGPNGAGKTTAISILATLITPTSGTAKVAGMDVVTQPDTVRRLIGYMPDEYNLYDDLTVWEYLDFFAACYQIREKNRKGILEQVLDLTDLIKKRDALIQGLSKGMRQRLCLARTLLHDPKVLLLDEPAAGLDPRARVELRELLKTLRDMGKTILVSSHILPELSDFCDSIGVIEAGRLVAQGRVADILSQVSGSDVIRLRFLGRMEEAERFLSTHPSVKGHAPPNRDLEIEIRLVGGDAALQHLLRDLIQAELPLVEVSRQSADLEDVFMRLTRGTVQ